MASEPVCIRRAATLEEAEIIAAWLDERDVTTTVVDPSNPGVMAFGTTDPEGISIYVADPATADRAMSLLAEHDEERAGEFIPASLDSGVAVTCDACGRVSSFPPDACGTVQECSECGTYVDVPEAGEGS